LRFRQEVLPPDWISPMTITAISLAKPQQLIAALKRQLSPLTNKAACKALLALKKALPDE
jgi:hypothetical protein